jgi:gliding motility-associated-like protein
MTGFEKNLKDSLLNFQPDISGKEQSWINIQKELKAKRRAKYFYAFAASLLVAGSTLALWPTQDIVNPTEIIQQKDTISVDEHEINTPSEEQNTVVVEPINEPQKTQSEDAPIITSDSDTKLVTLDSSKTDEPTPTEEKSLKVPSDKVNFFAELSVNNAKVCPGEKIQFHLNTKEPVMVEWTFSNGITSEELNPSFIATVAGKYAASVRLTSMVTGKEKTIYLHDGFEVFPKNNYNINVEEIHADNFERKYHLNVEGKNVVSVHWIGSEKTADVLKVELNERGNYQYTAEVFDLNGCKTVVNTNFDVETDNNLLAPTAFTPNGDEVNDEFLPKALNKLDDGKFLLRVLNPSTGKTLFETNTSSRSWDGVNPETGQKMKAGTYVWTAIIFGSKGNKTFKGKISIVD